MTPLEMDLKAHFTPGKPSETKEMEIRLPRSCSSSSSWRLCLYQFEEGWYFLDEEGTTHGPVFKSDLLEVVKAAKEWGTRLWNVNVLVDERLTFKEVFAEEVGKASIYKDVERMDRDEIERMVATSAKKLELEEEETSAAAEPANGAEASEKVAREEEEAGGSDAGDDAASHSSPSSLDMLLIQSEMQSSANRKKREKAEEKEKQVSEKLGSLKNLLQDAEALLATATPKAAVARRDEADEAEDEEQVVVEVQEPLSEEDLESFDLTQDFVTKYISLQRQSLLFRKSLFNK